jgi:hypothetical protein
MYNEIIYSKKNLTTSIITLVIRVILITMDSIMFME